MLQDTEISQKIGCEIESDTDVQVGNNDNNTDVAFIDTIYITEDLEHIPKALPDLPVQGS